MAEVRKTGALRTTEYIGRIINQTKGRQGWGQGYFVHGRIEYSPAVTDLPECDKNRLIRAQRLGTSGSTKRKLSQMQVCQARYFHCPRLYSFLFTWETIEECTTVAPAKNNLNYSPC